MIVSSASDYREAARRSLPRFLFDHVDGGANAEQTMKANIADLNQVNLRQRVLKNVSDLSLATEWFGQASALPMIIGPVGLTGMLARRGEVQTAGHLGRTALAHNALGGRGLEHMHGGHGVDHHGFQHRGFNGNAFGSAAVWNDWGDNFWGGDWGGDWGYWAGPVFWPFFYGDALTFALWPYDYDDPFLAYGNDALLASVFWPGPMSAPYIDGSPNPFDIYGTVPSDEDRGFVAYYGGRHHRHHGHHVTSDTSRHAPEAAAVAKPVEAPTCAGLAPDVANLPIETIEKAARPNDAQITQLNDLRSAAAQADNALRAACAKEVPLTPVGRLDAMAKRMQAMKQAVQMLREPLAKFYESFDPQQKERFAAIGATRRASARKEATTKELGGLCNRRSESFTTPPVQRIEETIKPTEQQKAAFDALKSASATAAKDLVGSCPAETPKTLSPAHAAQLFHMVQSEGARISISGTPPRSIRF
jgi:hypothetical protein